MRYSAYTSKPLTTAKSVMGMRNFFMSLHIFIWDVGAALERARGFRRHVFFVVLGQHLACEEALVGIDAALGDDALAFAKQIGQGAFVVYGDGSMQVGDDEIDHAPVGGFFHAAFF